MAKARHADDAHVLTDLPNVGAATAADFALLGIHMPQALRGHDPQALYDRLCTLTGQRHDPCVLDVFTAAVDFMRGAPARPWWHYTSRRHGTATTTASPARRRPAASR